MALETALIAGALASTAAAGTAAVAAHQQGQAQANAAEANADIQEMNARVATQQATEEESRLRTRARQIISEQRAGVAESGFALSGSTLDMLEQSEREAELDALTIRYKGHLARAGLLADADQQRAQAGTARAAGRAGLLTGLLGTGAAAAGGRAELQRARTGRATAGTIG